jgi:hypothetical protein
VAVLNQISPEDQTALREQRKAVEAQFTRLYPVDQADDVNMVSTPEGVAR